MTYWTTCCLFLLRPREWRSREVKSFISCSVLSSILSTTTIRHPSPPVNPQSRSVRSQQQYPRARPVTNLFPSRHLYPLLFRLPIRRLSQQQAPSQTQRSAPLLSPLCNQVRRLPLSQPLSQRLDPRLGQVVSRVRNLNLNPPINQSVILLHVPPRNRHLPPPTVPQASRLVVRRVDPPANHLVRPPRRPPALHRVHPLDVPRISQLQFLLPILHISPRPNPRASRPLIRLQNQHHNQPVSPPRVQLCNPAASQVVCLLRVLLQVLQHIRQALRLLNRPFHPAVYRRADRLVSLQVIRAHSRRLGLQAYLRQSPHVDPVLSPLLSLPAVPV